MAHGSFSLGTLMRFWKRNRSPDLRLGQIPLSSRLRSDTGPCCLSITVAGQWRNFTAFPKHSPSCVVEKDQAALERLEKLYHYQARDQRGPGASEVRSDESALARASSSRPNSQRTSESRL